MQHKAQLLYGWNQRERQRVRDSEGVTGANLGGETYLSLLDARTARSRDKGGDNAVDDCGGDGGVLIVNS